MKPNGYYKICPQCGCEFRTVPSIDKKCCSPRCGNLFKWKNEEYRKRMSAAHIGKPSGWRGKHPSADTILKLRAARFKGETEVLKNGYVYVYAPDHPAAINGRVPKQNVMAEVALGRFLKKGEIVHHVNEIKNDNRNDNFLICTESYHKWLHAKINGLGTRIQSNPVRDTNNGRFKPREERV